MKAFRISLVTLFFISLFSPSLYSQIDRINVVVKRPVSESHIRFLASDELKGRNTGTAELNIAARYVAEQFRSYGLTPRGDNGNFLQEVKLHTTTYPSEATAIITDREFLIHDNSIFIGGVDTTVNGDLYLVESFDSQSLEGVKGKIAIARLEDLIGAVTNLGRVNDLSKAGAIGLIEVYTPGLPYPWKVVSHYLSQQSIKLGAGGDISRIPHLWINDSTNAIIQGIKQGKVPNANIHMSGIHRNKIEAYNVAGSIQGTDVNLKEQFIIMSAHYDHVGIQQNNTSDTIYNGTRDNAIGVTGILNAARYFSLYPPKRSILFIALTAEEKGLLGSQYYTEHPTLPLKKCVFNLNIDNSGYNDTSVITIVDTGRTNVDPLIVDCARQLNLGVIGNLLPEENYYERSDQVSFAKKGIPAIAFKMGMTEMNAQITDYYHQPSDEVDNVDLDYIDKYLRAYILTAETIANWDHTPYWIPGDKFELIGQALYESR